MLPTRIEKATDPIGLFTELRAAGLGDASVSVVDDNTAVEVAAWTPDDVLDRVRAVIEAHDPMPARRKMAFDVAMAYGNTITAQVENQYANVERASFTAQEAEAKLAVADQPLPDDAILPPVAAHKGVELKVYAQQVLDNAAAYRKIAVAAIILRRGAEGLMASSIDTSEKLQAAVDALREQAIAFAKDLGLTL